MERIINNNKTKKILASFIIITILFSYIVPLTTYAASIAADLATAMGEANGNLSTFSEEQAQKIIDDIENADKENNTVTSSNKEGNIVITIKATNPEDVKKAFKERTEALAPGFEEGVVANGFSQIVVEIIKPETNGNNESDIDTEAKEMSEEEIATEAEEMSEIFLNSGIEKIQETSLISKEGCIKVINSLIKSSWSTGKEEIYCEGGIIYIKATNRGDISEAFSNAAEEPIADSIANDGYKEYGIIEITITERKQEDVDTPEERIEIWISNKYPGLSKGQIYAILEENNRQIEYYDSGNIKTIKDETPSQNMKYIATFNEEGFVTDVQLGEQYLRDIGVNDTTIIGVEQEQKEEEEGSADLGGILLEPVFYLINFIADAIISNLGSLMNGEGFTTEGVMVDPGKYDSSYYNTTNTTPHEIDLKSFLPDVGTLWESIKSIFSGEEAEPYDYPLIKYSPEEIFAGKIQLLSIDFITGKINEGERNPNTLGWDNIRTVVSQWYGVLRMVAIIGLLSVLIYTGVKIIISANAKDKAKYKEWIVNWFMAVAILFSMHIIMAFIVSVTGKLSELISEACQGINVELKLDGATKGVFVTNLMGLVRFMVQSENFYIKVGYEVMYIALIVYTVKFTLVYLKRVLNMAFLTLIAPIVALTYPIDKINDGRAQGFDMWLKEYIFNALLQPMHLILYYILVGSAVSIAAANPIYGIVVLMFMSEAEKLLKKIFGFDKAGGGTVGGMAGAFAAGAIASSVKDIARMSKLPKGNGGKGGSGNTGADNNMFNNPKPTGKNDEEDMKLFDDPAGGGNEPETEGANDEDNQDNQDTTTGQPTAPEPQTNQDTTTEQLPPTTTTPEPQTDTNTTSNETGKNTEQIGEEPTPKTPETPKRTIKDIAKKVAQSRQAKGMANVGKRLLKPVWDADKNAAYNFKRIAKGVGRAYLGASLGIGAAAVQAGISITDGKYNPMEGVATFAAGYAGGGQIAKGWESLKDTYREGAYAGDKDAIMDRAKKEWRNRDDVIKYNQKYDAKDREKILERQSEHYLPQGISDVKEMDRCMKYANKIMEDPNNKLSQKQADTKARVVHDFTQDLTNQGMQKAIRDTDLQEKYIATQTKGLTGAELATAQKRYKNLFIEAAKFQDANKT